MGQLTGYDKFIQQALKYGFSLFGLPPTGQQTVYRTGDDGTYQKGYPRSGARFIDNGDGTITDKATGLMWVKEPGAIGGVWGSAGNPSGMFWNNAIDNCLALNYAGHSDWRLPNIFELFSLVNFGRVSPSAYPDIFPYTKYPWGYWTSTTFSGMTTYALTLSFGIGEFEAGVKATAEIYVRPVRLGYPK